MKKQIVGLVVGLAVLLIGIVWYWPDGKVHVVACDVGQGDGIVIFKNFDQVLVDGGPNQKILKCLSDYMPFWDRQLELMVMTNADADHITGLIDVVKNYGVTRMVANNLAKDTERFKALRQAVIEEGVEVYAPKQGDRLKLGEMEFEVLWPEERLGDKLVWTDQASDRVLGANSYDEGEANEQSVVLRLVYGRFSTLLTGDVGSKSEQVLINSGVDLASDVLKVGHHGSKYASSEAFLRVVKPVIAMISVGKNNRYGHPTQEVLERLWAIGARILRTDEQGSVEVVSDGEKVWVR